MNKLKVMTVVGTRPEIIKLSQVMKELDEFLSHDFFPRFGGGIGMTRMARAMKLEGLI